MITYWDSSAIIPCLVNEEDSSSMIKILVETEDQPKFSSWLTVFEIETALKRKLNKKELTQREYHAIQDRWVDFQSAINFIPLDAWVARAGGRFQRLYGIRTGDSVQIGSASLVQTQYPDVFFICLDQQLSRYARQEGFKIINGYGS